MASSCCSPECGIRAERLRRRLERVRDAGGDDAALLKAFTALQKVSDRCEETTQNTERAELNTERLSLNAERLSLNTEHPAQNTERAEHPAQNTERAERPSLNTEHPEQNTEHAERPSLNAERLSLNTERSEHLAQNTERAEHPAQNTKRAEHPVQNTECAEHPVQNTERAEHLAQNTERAEHPAQNTERAEHPAQNTERAEHPAQNTARAEHPAQNTERAECLALYTQALLDVTYCEEDRLVEAGFPGDDSLRTVRDLVQLLSEPERHPQIAALDAEVRECLHWRRGALLYMYCHTVGERERWEPRHPGAFHQCLEDGVHYLLKMLHTRSPVQLDDEVLFQDNNTALLLEKGIFSDVHVLALMYCGEMCYWAQRYCRTAAPTSPRRADPQTPRKDLQFRDIGEKVLDTYVAVCEGPLRGQGWSTDNAKKILQYLRGGE